MTIGQAPSFAEVICVLSWTIELVHNKRFFILSHPDCIDNKNIKAKSYWSTFW